MNTVNPLQNRLLSPPPEREVNNPSQEINIPPFKPDLNLLSGDEYLGYCEQFLELLKL